MPDFQLSAREAEALARELGAASQSADQNPSTADPVIVDRGRELVQTKGCLNCHQLPLENRFQAKPWLALKNWEAGCLAEEAPDGSGVPYYAFTAEERAALRAVLHTGPDPFRRHVPAEFAERQTRLLRCDQCHGSGAGFPAWPGLGGKLKPEWMARLFAGSLPDKPRPWLPARMPAFGPYAVPLAAGLAEHHGFPAETPPEPPVDPSLAEIGRRLAGKDGGFSCLSCHGAGSFQPTEVFEAEGINFARVAERLQKSYFERWMKNPAAIDPQTKMPVYFDQGYSPVTDVLDGEADRQIEALWQYFRLGERLPPPATDLK